jgi:hypothetical protein
MSLVQTHSALMWRYKHRTRLETDREGDLLSKSHSVLKVWKNVHRVNGVAHTAESAVSEPGASEVQMANDWMHLHFVGTDHIQTDMIQLPDTQCVPKSTHLSPLRKKMNYMNGGKSPSKYLFVTSAINWQQHPVYSSDSTAINSIYTRNSYRQPSVKANPMQTNLLAIVSVHCDRTAAEERRGPDWVRDYENQNTVTNSSVFLYSHVIGCYMFRLMLHT